MRRIFSSLLILGAASASAQDAGVPIEASRSADRNTAILNAAEKLRVSGALMRAEKVKEQLVHPVDGQAVELPPSRTKPLAGRDIAAYARAAYVRVGWYYLCKRCDHWHLNLAGGYAIDSQGAIATCHHCVKPGDDMREGYLIAVQSDGTVRAVTAVLAANATLDAAVIRIRDAVTRPLPLNDRVAPGDIAYLYSEPFGTAGYFSSGIVNRFYWMKGEGGDAADFKDVVRLRFNAGTDWAPGSSGSALLDACGNAIGHVSTISALGGNNDAKRPKPTLITLHEAVPARGVALMLKAPQDASQESEARETEDK